MWIASEQRIFMATMLSLVSLAWLSLAVWGRSPYGRYLHHDALTEVGIGRSSGLLLLFVSGWVLMSIAMMLPTSLPLMARFHRMTAARPDGAALVLVLVGGYLFVWSGFGFVAHLADLGIHELVHRVPVLDHNEWAIGAGTLLLAGGYQFTSFKYRCLDQCRSPLTFIAGRWHGRNPRRDALHLGIDHGLFCVGCCWSLMLLMFLVGTGSTFWMLLLGGVMAAEKNLPWGRQLSAPLGAGLIGASCATTLLAVT